MLSLVPINLNLVFFAKLLIKSLQAVANEKLLQTKYKKSLTGVTIFSLIQKQDNLSQTDNFDKNSSKNKNAHTNEQRCLKLIWYNL